MNVNENNSSMDFKPVDKTIRDLLKSGHQFEIPRFQRAYSWEKRHYAEFLRDVVSNLKISKGTINPNPYFVGTMLFVGNFLDQGSGLIKVVDGQQRLTTITILFSVLSVMFKNAGDEQLSQLVFRYIMSPDDNGKEVRILKTITNYPYFAYFIQDYSKSHIATPETEEEENIKTTYDFFVKELAEKIAAVAGFKGKIAWDPSKPDGMYRKLLDSSRAHSLGWKPEITLDEGIAQTVQEAKMLFANI